MDNLTARSIIGVVSSLICTGLSGWAGSFNVISVDLKTTFNFTQTQVEFLATSSSAGLVSFALGSFAIDTFGYTWCYVIAVSSVTSSSVALFLSTVYVEIFRSWTILIGLFLFLSSAGCILANLCCGTIAIQKFRRKHTGKLIALYAASTHLGRTYYATVYQTFFSSSSDLGDFFLSLSLPFALSSICSIYFHVTPKGYDSLSSSGNDSPEEEEEENENENEMKSHSHLGHDGMTRKELMCSLIFQITTLSGALFQAALLAFGNNVVSLTKSVGVGNSHSVIYVVTACEVTSRFLFGFLFDCLGSVNGAILLRYSCFLSFLISMCMGMFWLDEVSVFIIAGVVSLLSSSLLMITKAMLNVTFGPKHYAFISGYLSVIIVSSTFFIHISIGFFYDQSATTFGYSEGFCKECFFSTFTILSAVCIVCIVLNTATAFFSVCRKVQIDSYDLS